MATFLRVAGIDKGKGGKVMVMIPLGLNSNMSLLHATIPVKIINLTRFDTCLEVSQPFETAKINNIFKLEVSFVLLSLVVPLSWQVDSILGQTNILFNPPFHVDHSNAIY